MSIGALRLDVWKDGRGVVSRLPRVREAVVRPVPLEPSAGENIRVLRNACLICLAAAAIAGAAGARLFGNGDYWYATGVSVVALALGAVAGMYLMGWRMLRPEVNSSFSIVRLFFASRPPLPRNSDRLLGRKPTNVDRDEAVDRLWQFACQLSQAQEPGPTGGSA